MGLTIDKSLAPVAYGNMGTSGVTRADSGVKSNDTPGSQRVTQGDIAELDKAKAPVKQPEANTSNHKDGITITYDNLAGVTVFKSFDSKGDVVTQAPPAQLLKTMELEGTNNEEAKGQIINKKV